MSMKKNLVIILAIILHSGINTATGQETDRVKNNPDSLAGRGDTATIFREMELQEVTIQASRIRNSSRGYTINLKDEPLCKGKTVSQLLGFLPGISVEDGVVKTDGKPVSIFYLNGMKVSSDDILKLPADVLNSAEVEYVAGSSNNATNKGGILRLTMRKPTENGYYGSLRMTAHTDLKYGYTTLTPYALVNFVSGRWSIIDNIYWYGGKQKGAETNTYLYNNGQKSDEQTENTYSISLPFNRLSITYDIDGRSSLGGALRTFYRSNEQKMNTLANGSIPNVLDNDTKRRLVQGTLQYINRIDDKGMRIEVNADLLNQQNRQNTHYDGKATDEQYDTKERTTLAELEAKLQMRLGKAQQQNAPTLSIGASVQQQVVEYNTTNNAFSGNQRLNSEAEDTRAKGLTPLAFATLEGKIKRLKWTAGLNWQMNRIEYTDRLKGTDVTNTQNSINPTVQASIPLDKDGKHELSAYYRHAISALPYSTLNPNIRWVANNECSMGNPNMIAPSEDDVEITLSLFNNMLRLSAYYEQDYDNLVYEQTTRNDGVIMVQPRNNELTAKFAGISANFRKKLTAWWTTSLMARFLLANQNETVGGILYDKWQKRTYFSMNHNFSLTKKTSATMSGNWEPTYRASNMLYHGVSQLWASIDHDFGKGLSLSAEGLLLRHHRVLDISGNGFESRYANHEPCQTISLTLRWNFSGGEKVNAKQTNNQQQVRTIEYSK